MKALLIVGMQVDLLPGGPAEVADSQRLVPVINTLMQGYELVVAANYSYPADHAMFAANHLWRKPGQTISIDGRPTLLHHLHCVAGSFGSELIPGLHSNVIRFTALMGTQRDYSPHSAFFDEGKNVDTGLAAFLASQKVQQLDVAGLEVGHELTNTLLDGIALGFEMRIFVDACKSNNLSSFEAGLNQSTQGGASAALAIGH